MPLSVVSLNTLPVALVVLLCAASGCSQKSPTGTVSGKVTYKDKPVTEGSIAFRNEAKGSVAAMKLGTAGEYELRFAGGKDIPIGDYVVTVNPPEPYDPIASELERTPPPTVQMREFKNIPVKYRSPQTSSLKATVLEGENRFDFELHN